MTGANEIIRGLDDLVSSGKVHYIGLSNAPSWILAQANTLANAQGWAQFSALQLEYSLAQRSIEAEYFPLLEAFDLNLSAWSPLSGGVLSGKYQQAARNDKGRFDTLNIDVSHAHGKLLATTSKIAQELDCSLPQLALAWIRQSNPRVIPLIGASKLSQLQDNLGCLSLHLDEEHFQQLESVSRPQLQEPYALLNQPDQQARMFGEYRQHIDAHHHRIPG